MLSGDTVSVRLMVVEDLENGVDVVSVRLVVVEDLENGVDVVR